MPDFTFRQSTVNYAHHTYLRIQNALMYRWDHTNYLIYPAMFMSVLFDVCDVFFRDFVIWTLLYFEVYEAILIE